MLLVLVLTIVVVVLAIMLCRLRKESQLRDREAQSKITQLQLSKSKAESAASGLLSENARLLTANAALKKQVDFYANIEEASGKLTVQSDDTYREQLLTAAVYQVEMVRRNPAEADRVSAVLDDEQIGICNAMEFSNKSFFVTGKAGTGKSFLLDTFRRTTNKSHIVLAPTGIAALNVNGVTIHSAFGYYNLVNLNVDEISSETIKLKGEKRLVLKNIETIIIDEISMVRADIFDKIDKVLKVINSNNEPFGGKQLLVFGDLFQLPPVTKATEHSYLSDRYGGIHFFCSDAYKAGDVQFAELTVNHRQKEDEEFFALLNRIREGHPTQEDIVTLNSRVVTDDSVYDMYTALLPTKNEVEWVNRTRINQLLPPEFVYKAEVSLNKYPEKTHNLEALFPILGTLKLRKGALVMLVSNDPQHRWVNGTLGVVHSLSENAIWVSIDKRTYEVPRSEFTEQEITYSNSRITYEDIFTVLQFPVVPAYAITIHKSQGQTYTNVVCDISKCFANGQAYVALSRCESLEGLHLRTAINKAGIQVDHDVLNFYRSQATTV